MDERYLAIDLAQTTYKEFFILNFPEAEFDDESFSVKIDGYSYYILPLNVENFDYLKIVKLESISPCKHLKFIPQGAGKPVICATCGEEL